MICGWHLCTAELTGRRTRFCSISCKDKFHVTKQRQKNKQKLVDFFGGKCVICGYNKSIAALQFHHVDDNKTFGIASKGATRAFEDLLNEASKCELICANCHSEKHNNYSEVG